MVEGHERALQNLYPDKCDRSIKNVYYQSGALSALRSTCDDSKTTGEAIEEICDRFPGIGRPNALKVSILAELGRIDDQDAIVAVAREISERSLSAKDAVLMVRQWRLGEPKEGDLLQLHDEIANAINNFWKRFPKTPTSTVINALEMMIVNVEESEGEEGEGPG